jgi:TrmH family RNA methyltransferase
LLTDAQRGLLTVVLVSPRNPLNIGAAARALTNFGFSRLTVVAPYEPHWREAKSAVGAESLLQNARVADTLSEAVAGCTLVLGTGTVTHRKPEQPVVSLPDLANFIPKGKSASGAKIALVFGQEKHGLTREDLALCHLLVAIPTDPRQPSMNLAQAVAVCLYELTAPRGPSAGPTIPIQGVALPAPAGDLEILAGVIEETMTAANYSPETMRGANRRDLNAMLRRLTLTRHDVRRVLGLFRRILFQLGSHSGTAQNGSDRLTPP